MFTRLLPPEVLGILLLAVLVGGFLLVLRAVRRRNEFARNEADAELPTLTTHHRIAATIRRVFRDPGQGVWLIEAQLGKRRLIFCATDYAESSEQYQSLVGQEADIAVYGLSTLAPGGVESVRDQIKDIDRVNVTPDLVRLVPAGEFSNDYFVLGKVLSHREDAASDVPVVVYRTEVTRNQDQHLVLELAVPAEPGAPLLPDRSMVHGSARLYGYLPGAAPG